MTAQRVHSLDVLRGYAIMTMILSATEAFRVLPAWMYHAQVPPPNHVFTPSIYGITWVDLIFPFFLFSMGAAIPLSVRRQRERGVSMWKLCRKSMLRWWKLAFFAIFIYHMFPFMMGYQSDWLHYAVPMTAFAWMFLLFMPNPFGLNDLGRRLVNGIAYAVAITGLIVQPYSDGKPFSPNDADIIILILANVAVAGTLIYLYTMNRTSSRWVVMAFVCGLFLSADMPGSWQKALQDFSPAPWLYQFRFLRYLLIIIPGTVAGDLLARHLAESKALLPTDNAEPRGKLPALLAAISLLMIVENLVGLYNRWLVANVVVTGVLLGIGYYLTRKNLFEMKLWRELYRYGGLLLALGLCMEAFQGGIRKDDVTFSYLFATSGLAFLALLFFSILCDYYHCHRLTSALELTGKNPMIAYVAASMVVIPILSLTGVYRYIDMMSASPWPGFLKGVLLTALSMGVAVVCTKRGWYWKT
uniref:DUF5009 domain-containing protein n=1 Tax=Prevotella sp. GTC17254 TaxID=3236794 RepID=A0AB33IXU3_9BACT